MNGLSDDTTASPLMDSISTFGSTASGYIGSAEGFLKRPVMVPVVDKEFPLWMLAAAGLAAYMAFGSRR